MQLRALVNYVPLSLAAISIGFEIAEYTILESGGTFTVQVVKENGQLSEQTFEIFIMANDSNNPGIANAELGVDYSFRSTNSSSFAAQFPPESQSLSIEIDIIPDSILEGIEAFRLIVSPGNSSAPFTLGRNFVTDVFITDCEC